MTNAAYNSFRIPSKNIMGIDRMVFSPQSMQGTVRDFFEFIFRTGELNTPVGFQIYGSGLAGVRDSMSFQQYCDVLYFYAI